MGKLRLWAGKRGVAVTGRRENPSLTRKNKRRRRSERKTADREPDAKWKVRKYSVRVNRRRSNAVTRGEGNAEETAERHASRAQRGKPRHAATSRLDGARE
ncbi:hypothetical protein NDU88_003369 [Pleurodeles waltl]|uniref:Uncharacterized protein n=1 Tax=Pleurodeles waltl TaxID=8319 RepID=A0AAV7RE47_PLEWA|nr:hypothetical protein NDU88_003369 [Pleurodeles waltl]